MKSVSIERPVTDAIVATDQRDMVIAYLSYALEDVRLVDAKAYQLLRLTIDSLGSTEFALRTH
jgi:hypothetical protein